MAGLPLAVKTWGPWPFQERTGSRPSLGSGSSALRQTFPEGIWKYCRQIPVRFYSGSCPKDYSEGFQSSPHQLCHRDYRFPVISQCGRVSFTPKPMAFTIHADASTEGRAGGHSDYHQVAGVWSAALESCYINAPELVAVLLSLKCLRLRYGAHVRLFIDNMTAVQCL